MCQICAKRPRNDEKTFKISTLVGGEGGIRTRLKRSYSFVLTRKIKHLARISRLASFRFVSKVCQKCAILTTCVLLAACSVQQPVCKDGVLHERKTPSPSSTGSVELKPVRPLTECTP